MVHCVRGDFYLVDSTASEAIHPGGAELWQEKSFRADLGYWACVAMRYLAVFLTYLSVPNLLE